ncbi:PAS domain-containing sensor histidine kinase [Brevibacillus fulvus]|uniref:histidine kinase n=1 Tax=Brevibacillus fulvus TaxID=1125967 RepID=A0A938XVL6_9BACL|nr:PAS domain-containing sensor histidine kinase [Brevibacillus fulvus]MBM7591293.1 two-component system sporulation sensor kinase A [Brevibacillus fulvus]
MASKQLYRSLFENNPDAVYALDLEGNLLSGNSVCEKICGYTLQELRKRTVLRSLLTEEDVERTVSQFRKSAKGELLENWITIRHKSGYLLKLFNKTFPIVVDDQIVGVYGIARDVTPNYIKKERLRESEERYRLLAENSFDIISKVSLNGKISYVTPSCLLQTGYAPENLIDHFLYEFIHPEDLDVLFKLDPSRILRDEVFLLTYRFRIKDGTYKWFETSCKLVDNSAAESAQQFIMVSRDITERRNAEEKLRQNEERYRNLVENSPDPVIIFLRDRLVFSNQAGIKLLGAENLSELLGKSLCDFMDSSSHERIREMFKELQQGREMELIEQKLVSLDGRVIDVELKGISTFYYGEPAVHLLVRDISERKKTQELLQNSEKLTLVGQLAAGIAHEIRNPLTALKGFLQLMQKNEQHKQEYYSIMSSELTRIEMIVSELLVLAKPQTRYFQLRDVAPLIRQVVTLLDTEAIMKKVQIVTKFEQSLPMIRCDENQLKQAFINFLKNGIESMPNGGEMIIEVRKSADEVEICFIDQGCGIPAEMISRLGEPFFTTKESGTGLGMMVSNKIIQNHQGTIQFISKYGEGTTVIVALPACYQPEEPDQELRN